jgi:hypothetical protein
MFAREAKPAQALKTSQLFDTHAFLGVLSLLGV